MHRCPRLGSPDPLPSRCLEGRCKIKHPLTLETSYPLMETHANSTPVQVYATCMCLPKRKAKERGHSQEILPRRLTTIWKRKAVWKTLFQNKSSGTINPVCPPRKLLNNTKNVSIKTTLSITTLAHDFYPAT